MTDTAQLCAEVRAVLEKMTPGKLRVWGPFPNAGIYVYPARGDAHPTDEYPTCLAKGTRICQHDVAEDHDIAGIVAIVNAAPSLVSAIEQRDEDNRRLREALANYMNEHFLHGDLVPPEECACACCVAARAALGGSPT